MPIFASVLPRITLKILFPLCFACGESHGVKETATKLVPGIARPPGLQTHGYAWDPSGHMEILEGSAQRGTERRCLCLRLNPTADERPHYTCTSWDTYMTKSTRQSIRGELK